MQRYDGFEVKLFFDKALAEDAEQAGISLNALVAQKIYITTQIGSERRTR